MKYTLAMICYLLANIALAGGGESYKPFFVDRGFNVLHHKLIDTLIKRPTNFNSTTYTWVEYSERGVFQHYNLRAWAEFLNISKEDAELIIYKKKNLDSLPKAVREYMDIAHEQEPLVNFAVKWKETAEDAIQRQAKEAEMAKTMIKRIEKQLETTKAPFLRQRYVFLMIRLAHYTNVGSNHSEEPVARLYEKYNADINALDNEVKQWIISLKAGSLRANKPAESAYLFAMVYRDSTTKRVAAHVDFRITTDEQWSQLIALCKNDNEKALMHFMRATKTNANTLEEFKTIYALAPNSKWLDSLLYRELEYVQFSRYYEYTQNPKLKKMNAVLIADLDKYQDSRTTDAERKQLEQRRISYLQKLSTQVKKIIKENKRKDLFFARYAQLYLELLSTNKLATSDVQSFIKAYAQDPRAQYVNKLELYAYLNNMDKVDANKEREISNYLEAIAKNTKKNESDYDYEIDDYIIYTFTKLESFYKNNKEEGKHYVSKNRGDITIDNMIIYQLRDLNALLKKDKPSALEVQLSQPLKEHLKHSHNIETIYAKKYLSAGLFSKAKESLEQAKNTKQWKTTYNPFTTSRGSHNRIKSTPFTMKKFTEVVLEVQRKIKENPENSQNHFILATAYYNMSWFGNSPMLIREFRSTTSHYGGALDMTMAKKHYQKIIALDNDRELVVKSLYALAKIENNENLIKFAANKESHWPDFLTDDHDSYAESMAKKKALGFGIYFKKIKDYQDTQYYNEVIKECAAYMNF
ncbi:MAG: hypothetical protein KAH22_01660 [Thiotrichaceae bacterium]|nr:hypothetical protein [Thiotrichaceae bacterium]